MAYPQNLDAFDVLTDINETNIAIINEYKRLLSIAQNSMTQADLKKADDYYATNESVLKGVIPRASYFNSITDAIKEIEKYVITTKEQILVRDKDTNYTDKSQSDYDEVLANQAVEDIWVATSTISDYTMINSVKVKKEDGTYTELYTLAAKSYVIDITEDNVKANISEPSFKIMVYDYRGTTNFRISASSTTANYLKINIPMLKDGDEVILYNNTDKDLKFSHVVINDKSYAFFTYGKINTSLETVIKSFKYRHFIFREDAVGNNYSDFIGMIQDNGIVNSSGLLDYNEINGDSIIMLDEIAQNNNISNYFATLPDSTYGDYNTISSFKSRKLVGNTYSVSAVVDISISDNMLSSFNSAFNTYGEIEHGWYPLFQIGTMDSTNNFVNATFPENQYLGVFRMYDHQHVNAPEYCTLGITTNGVIVISGGNHTFKVGETWRLPFNITFTAI
jgi:hypothetical protein